MKILIIGDFCYPNYMGGSSKHVYDLITHFSRISSVELKLITRQKQEGDYSATEAQAEQFFNAFKADSKIIELNKFQLFNPLYYYKYIRDADVVILQHPIMGFLGSIIAKLFGKPIIYHYHGPIHEEYRLKTGKKGLHYKLLWLLQKITVINASKVLTHSEYMKKIAMKEHGLPLRKSLYLPPYIEQQEFNEPLNFLKRNDKTKFLIPRRLTARTGVVEFLKTFISLPKDKRDLFDIYISGKGELQKEVEELVQKDLDNLCYVGFLSYQELWSMYQQVDAVIVPTLDLEGFGYIILEALSCGASAVVSKTCGGGYEFVTKYLGETNTFDVYSPKSLSHVLEHISKTKFDRLKNIEIADIFSVDNMVDNYIRKIIPATVSER